MNVAEAPPALARFRREVGIALLVGVLGRVGVLLALPKGVSAFDLRAWSEVVDILAAGQNPYNLKAFLSWPPAWMQILFCLDGLARRGGWPLAIVIRLFLILADAAGLLLAAALIRRLVVRRVLWPLLIGWSLNPIPILLVCQHGNFDNLVALCILASLLSFARFRENRNPVLWLWACAWLGAGVALKTIPLALAPLLIAGRGLRREAVSLGLALVLGPALYGLSVIYVLGPAPVRAHVLGYRSLPGWFGVSGLLTSMGKPEWVRVYGVVFVMCYLAGMGLLAVRLRGEVALRRCLFGAAGLLAAIPALGPGYGPQYIAWFLPLLVVAYVADGRRTKIILLGFGCIASVTYLLEYALIPSHGAFVLSFTSDAAVLKASRTIASERWATLARLPLFGAYLALVVHLIDVAWKEPNLTPATG